MTTTTNPSTLAQAMGFLGCMAIVFVAAALGAAASIDAATFYAQLVRPSWAPPASAFGPVWSILYLSMGVAAWLVWRERGAPLRRAALGVFLVQLCANALWSWLFFAWRNGAGAFAEVLLLLALIVATIALFGRVRRPAAILLLPYVAWVCLASALTWSVWRNNPGLL
jgi:benzodiazapine receptor